MTVSYEAEGHVAILTIRRPASRNAISPDVARAMEASIDRLEADDAAWVGVLAGEGPVFSAGADLKAISAGEGRFLSTSRGGFAGIVRRHRSKPLIAAVDGPALAGGCEIALACDLIVASTAAEFGLPEVRRGLIAAGGGLFRLPRALPRAVAMHAILTGAPVTAARAYRLGMVTELVDSGQAVTAARALAETICDSAPLAVRASRSVAAMAHGTDDDTLWRLSEEAALFLTSTEDFREGPRAFAEKRLPAWTGR
jgi:enoyl-CoA hydratase